jgi:hypothetical protein
LPMGSTLRLRRENHGKITNERLAEIALTNPKRFKRCAFLSTFVPFP